MRWPWRAPSPRPATLPDDHLARRVELLGELEGIRRVMENNVSAIDRIISDEKRELDGRSSA